jgi:predicted alpha/beta hydrolase
MQDLILPAADGYKLAATLHTPDTPAPGAPQWIVIGCATAVPRGFYKRFGEYVASKGLHAIVADYRGIGGSKYGSLRGFKMNYSDWSKLDLAAIVEYATARGESYLVGHSLAGHALGQLPQPNALRAAYFCGSGAGWHGWMPAAERFKVQLMWNVIGPVSTTVLGYHPMSKFGLGEDLPLGVYRDWKYWCSFPNYFFNAAVPDSKIYAAEFSRVTIPIAAAVSTDDLWAPPTSRDVFFKGYSNAKVEAVNLEPNKLNAPQIGHMGYFRKEVGQVLWPQIMDWLKQSGLRVAV